MAKAGRKNKYYTHVKPYLDKITEYAKTMLEKDIAKALGVGADTFCEYKNDHPELVEALKKGQQNLVSELKSTMIKKALGYSYEEEDIEIAIGVDNIEKKKKVIHKRYAHPDTGAMHLLLKNYDRENWSNDWKAIEIKQAQLEIDKKLADMKTEGW